MEPTFVDLPDLHVLGLSGRYTGGHTEGIPDLWVRFVTAWTGLGRQIPEKSYGFCYDEGVGEEGAGKDVPVTYMAAFPVEGPEDAPEGLEARIVPANRYAVFTSKDGVAGIGEMYRYVFETWMPESGYRRGEGPDFELYDDRFDPETMTGEIDIWVPVVKG